MNMNSGISPTSGATSGSLPPKVGLLTKLLSKIDSKTRIKALENLEFQKIGKGKAKIVVKKKLGPGETSSGEAFYVPVANFLGRAKKELKDEHKTMEKIRGNNNEDTSRLALAEKATEDKKIGGLYTLVTEEAKGDFEKTIKRRDLTLDERKKFGSNLLEGFNQLHERGFAYGDLKPENLLVFKDGGLKIGDFGKTKKLVGDGNGDLPYTGNLRFAPPEGRLSKKGDVYGAGLALIRTFEELLPKQVGKSLVPIDAENVDKEATTKQKDGSRSAPEGIRGIEKYIIEHKAFLGIKVKGLKDTLFKALRRYAKVDKRPEYKQIRQKELIDGYIDELTNQLFEAGMIDTNQELSLNHLLRQMTNTKPENRPTMQQALDTYNKMILPSSNLPHG